MKTIFAAVVLLLQIGVAGQCIASPGDANDKRDFDIAPGDASYRLNDFSKQSGLQLLFGADSMTGVSLNPVHGRYKPSDALDRMIAGTDVHYEFVNRRTLAVRRRPAALRARSANDAQLEEVVVESARSGFTSLGGLHLSIRRSEIDALGFATVQGVVGRTLPQAFGGGPSEDTTNGFEARTNTARGTGINLRGLGASSTLVLLNGNRLAGAGSEGLFVDVSNLPLAAVERIDILPDSSSTFYGADAVGGVVNFVMRDHFEGMQTEAYYGASTRGQFAENYVSQLVGGRSDHGHGLIALDFYSRDNLPAASRAQARSDLREFGGSNFDYLQSNPGNILWGPLTWSIPRGQDGRSLQPSDLRLSAPNLQNRHAEADLLPSQQRWSIFATGSRQLTERLKLFADLLAGERNIHSTGTGQIAQFSVPDWHPFYVNPTGAPGPITMTYSFIDDFGPMVSTVSARTLNVAQGLDLKMENGWTVTWKLGHASERMSGALENIVDSTRFFQSLAEPDPAKAFNPFGDGSNTPASVLEWIRTGSTFTSRSTITSSNLIASGPLVELATGAAVLTFGTDWRKQSFESRNRASNNGLPANNYLARRIQGVFAEVQVPIVGPASELAGMTSLTLSLAERYERYSDFGNTLAGRFGLSWEPLNGLTVTGTYSESFRPPGLIDLDESSNAYGILPLQDPQTGENSNVLFWVGQNRDLHEETARSWTAGLELAPQALSGGIAITYFSTSMSNRLRQPALTYDLLSDPAFSALVTRDPSESFRDDVCARAPNGSSMGDCRSTPILAIADLRTRNDAYSRTSGFDLLGRYALDSPLGQFTFGINGTHLLEFSEARSSNAPLQNLASTPTHPVNLRLRGSGRWQYRALDVSAYVNYVNSYSDTVSVPRRHVSSWTTADIHASYNLSAGSSGWFGDTRVALGVSNLLDTDPPFLNNPIGIGYDQENGDLTGRMVSVTVRRGWSPRVTLVAASIGR